MDLLQSQAAIEQALNYILSQGPNAMKVLTMILIAIKYGATTLWGVSTIIAKWPILTEGINKLLELINSGAGIGEIAAALAHWASEAGASVDALLQLLYTLGGFVKLF